MCWTGPDATGSRGPGGAGRCWVPAWWPRGGRVVADGGRSLPWLPFSQGNRKQEGREREDEKKRRRFQVYHHKLGLGERAWGPPAGCACGQSLALPDHILCHRQEVKGATEGLCCSWGAVGSAARLACTRRRGAGPSGVCARGHPRARAPFIPAGEPSRPLPCPVCVARTSSTGHSLRVTRCRRRSTSFGRVLLRRRARSGRPSRTSSSPTRSGTLWTKPKVSERLPLRPARAREALEPRHGSHGADSHSGDAGKSKLPREPVEL